MTAKRFSQQRRRLLKHSATGLIALGTAHGTAVFAQGDSLPRVSEDSQLAQSLKYVHDASESELRENDNERCRNCLFYKGDPSAQWGECQLFQGKAVNTNGWCNNWMAQQ